MNAPLGLIGRDRFLLDKLVKEIRAGVQRNYPTRGLGDSPRGRGDPYETRRGGVFDIQVQLPDDRERIYRVTVELMPPEGTR